MISGLSDGTYQMIILNREFKTPAVQCVPCGTEHLYFSVPPEHRISERNQCSFSEMNGENFIVAPNIGYWDQIIREQMPDSRFFIQDDMDALSELIQNSTMPAFVTDITSKLHNRNEKRVFVPISDEAAVEHFFCCCKADDTSKYARWFQTLDARFDDQLP